MAQLQYLASTLVTGTALIAVAYLFVRTNQHQRAAGGGALDPARGRTGDGGESRLGRIARTPSTWYLGFAAAALGVLGAAVVAVGTTAFSGSAGTAAVAALAALVALYMFLGTYATARSRGRPESLAVAEGIGVIGGLALLGMVVVLVLG